MKFLKHLKPIFVTFSIIVVLAGFFGMYARTAWAADPCVTEDQLATLKGKNNGPFSPGDALYQKYHNNIPDKGTDGCTEIQNFLTAIQSSSGDGSINPFAWILGFFDQIPMGIWYILMYLVLTVLNQVLTIVAFFMNNIFYYAIVLNPINMPVVVEGWTYFRDLANGLFILIVLWIAFTIIFNIEEWGGKKLLFKVIVVALLINFSLALVSVVFALSNQLSLPFYNVVANANKGDLGGLILQRTHATTVFQQISSSTHVPSENLKIGIDPKTNCGFSALAPNAGPNKGCLGADSMGGAFAERFVDSFTKGANVFGLFDLTVNMIISIIILSFVIAAFIGISATLLLRIIAMVFLGITAPAAFMVQVVPGGKAQGLWSKWLHNLFCWAFIAPAFYFLFYISLRMLVIMTDASVIQVSQRLPILANLLNLIPFIVFLAFLWASIMVGRWMGCGAGDIAIDWGKKLAKAGVRGTAMATGALIAGPLGAGAVAGRVAGTLAGAARTAATKGGIKGAIGGAVARRTEAFILGKKQTADKYYEDIKHSTPENVAADLRSRNTLLSPEKISGAARHLAETKRRDVLSESEWQNALNVSRQFGYEKSILNANPDLALEINPKTPIQKNSDFTALDNYVSKMKLEDVEKIDLVGIGHGRTEEEQGILREHVMKLASSKGPEALQKISTNILSMKREDRKKALDSWQNVMNDATYWKEIKQNDQVLYENSIRYMVGKAGKGIMGREIPQHLKADADRIAEENRQQRRQRPSQGNQPPKRFEQKEGSTLITPVGGDTLPQTEEQPPTTEGSPFRPVAGEVGTEEEERLMQQTSGQSLSREQIVRTQQSMQPPPPSPTPQTEESRPIPIQPLPAAPSSTIVPPQQQTPSREDLERTQAEEKISKVNTILRQMGFPEKEILQYKNPKDFREVWYTNFLDRAKTGAVAASPSDIKKLEEALNMEEVAIRAGEEITNLNNVEVKRVRGGGKKPIVDEILERGYMDKATGVIVKKPKVSVRLEG